MCKDSFVAAVFSGLRLFFDTEKLVFVSRRVNYISGCTLYDSFSKESYYRHRSDVLSCCIYLPANAPRNFLNLQELCDAINNAERRRDARTAREFICSLPNELRCHELEQIVSNYIQRNFTDQGLCAIAAIHEGINREDPSKNNPHVHILVSTRTVGPEGFSRLKDREHDKREYIGIWRKDWERELNRAYERCGLDVRVSCESLAAQHVEREPLNYLSRIDYQREQRGERTQAGERRRAIRARNEKLDRQRQMELEREMERERDYELERLP